MNCKYSLSTTFISITLGLTAVACGAESDLMREAPIRLEGSVRQTLVSEGSVLVTVMLEAPGTGPGQQSANLATSADVIDVLRPLGTGIGHQLENSPALGLELNSQEELDALLDLPQVVSVQQAVGGVAFLDQSRGLIGANAAFSAGVRGTGRRIAVLDTGISHVTDLNSSIVQEACICRTNFEYDDGRQDNCCSPVQPYVSDDVDPTPSVGAFQAEDDTGHGTHVAGIISSDGQLSPRGVAPDAGVVVVKVMNNGVFNDILDIAAAMEWLANNNNAGQNLRLDAVTMSLGTNTFYGDPSLPDQSCDRDFQVIYDVVQTLRDQGVLVIAASGNRSTDNTKDGMAAPACVSNVIAVGATADTGSPVTIPSYSNSSRGLDIVAPGSDITSVWYQGGSATLSGTSMAAPHVAAAVAMLRQQFPTYTAAQIQSCLVSSPTWIGDTNGISRPLLNIQAAQTACAALSIAGKREAENYAAMAGIQFETTSDTGGGQNASYIGAGDYIEWDINAPTTGSYTVTTRSATWAAAGLQVLVDGVVQRTLSLPRTWNGTDAAKKYQTWANFATTAFTMNAGAHKLRIAFTSGNQNLNYISVSAVKGASLLLNSNFATNMTSWSTQMTAPSAGKIFWDALDGGVVKADMTVASASRSNSRVYQNLNIVAGKTYTVSAKLRHRDSTGNETLYMVVEKNAAPYTKYADRAVTLTNSTWNTYTGTFTATASEQVRIQMMLGRVDSGVRIDDFKFCEGLSCQ